MQLLDERRSLPSINTAGSGGDLKVGYIKRCTSSRDKWCGYMLCVCVCCQIKLSPTLRGCMSATWASDMFGNRHICSTGEESKYPSLHCWVSVFFFFFAPDELFVGPQQKRSIQESVTRWRPADVDTKNVNIVCETRRVGRKHASRRTRLAAAHTFQRVINRSAAWFVSRAGLTVGKGDDFMGVGGDGSSPPIPPRWFFILSVQIFSEFSCRRPLGKIGVLLKLTECQDPAFYGEHSRQTVLQKMWCNQRPRLSSSVWV